MSKHVRIEAWQGRLGGLYYRPLMMWYGTVYVPVIFVMRDSRPEEPGQWVRLLTHHGVRDIRYDVPIYTDEHRA
jgi:hypothetical protein